MSKRAESLAARIEEGAKVLAAFAEKLSDAEWRKPMVTGNDRRTVGVVVHHVAFVYPIEIDLAKTIASGKAADVTWEAVAELNANHAKDQAPVTKAEALDFLRKNSKAAADARPRAERRGARYGRAVRAGVRGSRHGAVRDRGPSGAPQLAPSREDQEGARQVTSGAGRRR